MNAIYSVFAALANFARSLNRLAAVADQVAEEAEKRVEVVGYHGTTPAILAPMPDAGNGRLPKRVSAK